LCECIRQPKIFPPFAGVLVDRWERHRTLIGTQVLSMLQSSLLAILAFTGAIDVWHLIALSIFQGLINAFDMPARQAFVVDMVDNREDLSNAIALNSSMFSGARLVGPAIAGLAIAAVGASFCFLIDALSYVAVITGLLAMKLDRKLLTLFCHSRQKSYKSSPNNRLKNVGNQTH
jgi:MFS family permease